MQSSSLFSRFLFFSLILWYSCTPTPPKTSGAGQAMEYWSMLRDYPDGRIYTSHLHQAYEQWHSRLSWRNEAKWETIGPKNVGGRTLCLAFHPQKSETIYAGSAGGGLWKSETGGQGVEAWKRIRTGYPVLGVSTIAINPNQAEEIFIGTGEVYNYRAARPGIDDRFNRGSYGIGILKSSDGGQNWEPSLDWRNTELRGVWKIIYNPLHAETLLAATTEGIFRTWDSGRTWQQISDRRMVTDLEMHPLDTNIIYASHGGYQSLERGIYRSTNGGLSFELLDQLPALYTGKAAISLVPSEPDWLYASIADAQESIGLFRSIDRGETWTLLNKDNVAKWQGWYAHDVAINPIDPKEVIYVGIDVWFSNNSGFQPKQRTFWQRWQFGKTEVGAPEGPHDYVHADVHAAYYHPADANRIFLATDGGIFESTNGGSSWTSRNGSYQTQQFYADFASSQLDSNLAIGGLQDNSTVLYTGEDAWTRRIGGDGMSAAIDPRDDNFVYGSLQNLQVLRSANRGETFRRLTIGNSSGESRNFNGPFVVAPSHTGRIYAGAQHLYSTDDRGDFWKKLSGNKDGDNVILKIAVATDNRELLYISTNSLDRTQAPAVFKATSGGDDTWTRMEGLPERLCTDLVFHPTDSEQVYAVFGGYNTPHLFYTKDGGQSWVSINNNLPDLPASTLFIDPLHPEHLYLGNDMGVFASQNGGEYWEWISEDIAEAVMVMDLSLSPTNRKLRVATHGLGAYELALDRVELEGPVTNNFLIKPPFPNPTRDWINLDMNIQVESTLEFQLVDALGRVLESHQTTYSTGDQPRVRHNLQTRENSVYWLVVKDLERELRWVYRVMKI